MHKISLNFKDISARDLLALLCQMNHINLILSDAVAGTLTIHLDQVTWSQALNTILEMQNLSARQEGNILFIAPVQDMISQDINKTDNQALQSILVQIHYTKASDLDTLLKNKTNDFLSERGSIIVDQRTNQLWIKDTPERVAQIRIFLKNIDIPSKQVKISARIVNIDEQSVHELGLKFGEVSATEKDEDTQSLHTDLPLTLQDVGHFTVAIAKLSQSALLDLEISALAQEGHAQIISNPQLVTANLQPAAIASGQEIPYQEKTSSGATSTSFKKAVLSLEVTPEITSENKVILNLVVNQDKVDTLTVNGVPAISTQQIQSHVWVNNKETIVLGGIYQQSQSQLKERIPFWSKIPILGKIFSDQTHRSERRELLIFVTPEIL